MNNEKNNVPLRKRCESLFVPSSTTSGMDAGVPSATNFLTGSRAEEICNESIVLARKE